ncbi:radical SAM protein [Deltaproteobacteria bacterium OttesenSCG-928-K17]|nr:radical SAM protein [Deltaproteobacteria bacterium OttesenSCG-928-K17]
MWKALTRNGIKPKAFLDSSPRFADKKIRGLDVHHPDKILNEPGAADKVFIITASGHWEDQLTNGCCRAGLTCGRDFLSFNDLVPIQPAIEISGVCNLRCQGCPRGNMTAHPPAGFMSAATYALVLDKLLKEIPLLGSVQLYTWGEPLLNREYYDILAETRRRDVLSVISTNLNLKLDIQRFVASGPGLVRLSASGWGKNYEMTHTGGSWDLFAANFKALARERREQNADFEVELYYHLYRHNRQDDYQRLKDMAEEAGFVFRPILGSLYPWDNIFKIINGEELTETAVKHQELLLAPIDGVIKEARKTSAERPCTQVRCFPINWDLTVLGCGGWYLPRLADNFLNTPLKELIKAKADSALCRRCANLAIHKINFTYMEDQASLNQSPEGR